MSKWDNTPRTPQWAEDAAGTPAANNTDPLTAKQYLGWVMGEGLVSATLNWLLGHHGTWLWFLNTLLGRLFDRDSLLRGGNANEGTVTATYMGGGLWDLELTVDCYGWADGEAFLCSADTVTIDPTGTGSDSAWFIAVATATGFAVRVGADAASPVRPTLSAGDVPLFEIKLADGTVATSEYTDLRQRGSYRGGRVVVENEFRAGDDGAGGWLFEVDGGGSGFSAVRAEAQIVTLDSTTSTVVDGQSTTVRAAGNVTIESDGGGDVEVSGRTVRTDERYVTIPGQVLALPYDFVGGIGSAFVGKVANGLLVDQSENAGSEDVVFFHEVDVPRGSTITAFTLAADGAGAAAEYTARLLRQEIANDNAQLLGSVTGAGAGDISQTDSSIASAAVADDHGYYLEITVPYQVSEHDLVIHGARVAYTPGEI